eukprot:1027635-Prorocentrum_minimum.AAC.1
MAEALSRAPSSTVDARSSFHLSAHASARPSADGPIGVPINGPINAAEEETGDPGRGSGGLQNTGGLPRAGQLGGGPGRIERGLSPPSMARGPISAVESTAVPRRLIWDI